MQELPYLKESPSQTAGPYVHIGCTPNFCGINGVYDEDPGARMVDERTQGALITLSGVVYDGMDAPMKDVMVEIWQADAAGIYPGNDPRGNADPHFTGWGRKAGDYATGEWVFETIKPGRVPFKDGRMMAPHITLWIVARGINTGLHTRIYFPDEDAANAEDPVLMQLEHKSRIPTLIAEKTGPGAYRFDVRLQGERETIFFDI